jgi:hypothetical protein
MGTRPEVDESLALEQIEDDHWGSPPADATQLIKTVYALRHKPVGAMDAEDLRVLLLQKESIEVLTPVALTHLEQNPLAEGDFYPGDLLTTVLKLPQAYWQQHPGQLRRASAVIEEVDKLGNLDEHEAPLDIVRQQIDAFRSGTLR